MKNSAAILASLCASVVTAAVAASPPVEVRFTDPTKFTDLRITTSDTSHDAADLADEFRRYLERRTPAFVPAGKRLEVTITDVDMAGELRPSRSTYYMLRRQITGIDPPRVDLEFRLVGADGTIEREGRRELRNNAYLYGKYARQRAPLVHEKALLEGWLAAEFPRAPGRGGLLDPAKVTRFALKNAASVAGLVLTTDALVAELPKDEQSAALGGGMGEMEM